MITKTKKFILIFSSIFCAVLICTALFLKFFPISESNLIAFYRVPEKVQTAVIDLINSKTENKNKAFEALVLDSSISLESQNKIIKKCSCLIYTNDSATEKFLNTRAMPIGISVANGFPNSIVNSLKIKTNGENAEKTIKIIPFLYDFYEIDINYPIYKKTGMKSLDVWNDLIEAAYYEKAFSKAPLILPVADDRDFVNIMGLIAEALCGYEAYEKMTEKFDIEAALASDQPLGIAAKEIRGLLKSGIIPQDSLNFKADDILFYMDYELSGINFTTLSQHRKISNKIANNYTSIYCPSKEFTPDRKFAAEQISVSLLKNNDSAKQLITDLTDNLQTELATRTGLSPVQKNCGVPDHQADDVRFWLAASKGPVMPLANLIGSEDDIKSLADRLRDLVREE